MLALNQQIRQSGRRSPLINPSSLSPLSSAVVLVGVSEASAHEEDPRSGGVGTESSDQTAAGTDVHRS